MIRLGQSRLLELKLLLCRASRNRLGSLQVALTKAPERKARRKRIDQMLNIHGLQVLVLLLLHVEFVLCEVSLINILELLVLVSI